MIQAHYIYCTLYFYYYYIVIYNEIIIQLTIMLTEGRVQVVMRAMGRGYKYRWSFTHLPLLTSCCAVQFLTGHRPVLVRGPGVGDPWFRGAEGLRDHVLAKNHHTLGINRNHSTNNNSYHLLSPPLHSRHVSTICIYYTLYIFQLTVTMLVFTG